MASSNKKYIFQETTKEVYSHIEGDQYLFLSSFEYFGIRFGDSRQKRIGRVKALEGMPRFHFTFSKKEIEGMG